MENNFLKKKRLIKSQKDKLIQVNFTCFFLHFCLATQKFKLHTWLTCDPYIVFLLDSTALDKLCIQKSPALNISG